MMTTPSTLDTISSDDLTHVTGAGIATQIGSLFGAKGAKWGGLADSIIGMFKGGGASPAGATASSEGGASASAEASA